jgi:chemotaxis signal transduction protein
MRHLCVMIGGERFALAARDVHEVAPAIAARSVPGAPAWCRGFACQPPHPPQPAERC